MAILLKQTPKRSAGALDQVAIDVTNWLDGDTLTGSVTTTEQVTSDLTITNAL